MSVLLIILKILGAIIAYLIIGIFVTGRLLKGQRIHVGAAFAVMIMPLVWPLLIPQLVRNFFSNLSKKRRDHAAWRRQYAERMAACPPGYEAACNVYYIGHSKVLAGEKRFSRVEGKYALLMGLKAGNLPAEPAARVELLRMAGAFVRADEPDILILKGLMEPELPPGAGYAAGCVLAEKLRAALYEQRENGRPAGDIAPDIELLIAAWERWLKLEPSPLAPLSLGSWHAALWRLLPKTGAEAAKHRSEALRLYKEAISAARSVQELWCAFYGCLELALNADELAEALDAAAAAQSGESFDDNMPDYALLPPAWRFWPVDYQDIRSPERLLREFFWPRLADEDSRLLLTRRLVPVMLRQNSYFTLESRVRPLLYDRYARGKDLRWADLFLDLAYDEAQRDKNPRSSSGLIFFRAENAFMRGNKTAAEALLREYRKDHYAPNLAISASYSDGGSWGGGEEGREFYALDELVRFS